MDNLFFNNYAKSNFQIIKNQLKTGYIPAIVKVLDSQLNYLRKAYPPS